MSAQVAIQFYVARPTHEPSNVVPVMARPNSEAGIFTPAFFDALIGKRLQVVRTPRFRGTNLGFTAKILGWSLTLPASTVPVPNNLFMAFTLSRTPPRAWTGTPPNGPTSGLEVLWVWLVDPYPGEP